MPSPSPRPSRPWYLTFHDLMPFRVREILLVSAPYDAFILEGDGQLTEHIFTESSELNLSAAPRITHVSNGARALEMLEERRFDLVLTLRIPDYADVNVFAREVKRRRPELRVALLVLTEADLTGMPGGVDPQAVDRVFVWTGDARIILTIIKLLEDALNVGPDTKAGGVRVIIVAEASVRRHSTLLGLLYSELMEQSDSLVAEGVNDLHRLLRMRARPKVLHASSYEQALELHARYREHVSALITDLHLSRGGVDDPRAGELLVEHFRRNEPDLPVLLLSSDKKEPVAVAKLGASWVDQDGLDLGRAVRDFVHVSLGFGPFVFRLPDRTEVARARDMYELEQALHTVPAESVAYHACRNHFSLWLQARSAFDLAARIRPQHAENQGGIEGLRESILHAIRQELEHQQDGVISDFSPRRTDAPFVRLGKGSIGGKARGVAFMGSLLGELRSDPDGPTRLSDRYPGLSIRVPRSAVVATGEFERFVDSARLQEVVGDDRAVLRRALEGRLSESIIRDLYQIVQRIPGPLSVRSSSLLEDSQLQPFAGIYSTYILPNNHPDPEVRVEELRLAIKAVMASTFNEDARAYRSRTPYSQEEEKMAVLIQEAVGQTYGSRFYPAISGVALSWNYYPVGHQRAEDGLALVALGFGHTIVRGRTALSFSPATPQVLPQFGSTAELLRLSQSSFYALDLSRSRVDFVDDASMLRLHDLADAEEDGALGPLGSVYSPDDDVVRDNLSLPGPRLVTFNNILKYNSVPLAPALQDLLALGSERVGCPVEMEFAVDLGDRARRGPPRGQEPALHVLQVRPQATQLLDSRVEVGDVAPEQIFCRTRRSLGHGVIDDLRDILYVKRDNLESHETPGVAEQVGQLSRRLHEDRTPYLLAGPGRWGSSDPRLGIPVKWSQIVGARVIIETAFPDRDVEPSQGAHFFHNVTSFRIGYLTLFERGEPANPADPEAQRFDARWLASLPVVAETADVRHVRLERPLRVFLDGRKGTAAILKP